MVCLVCKSVLLVKRTPLLYTLQSILVLVFRDINYTDGWEMRKDTAGLLDISQPPGVSMYCVYGNGSATTERSVDDGRSNHSQQTGVDGGGRLPY